MKKECLYCGSDFSTNRNNKKYCSTNCKQMAYFTRNGMVLAGTAGNVKYDHHSEKPETVKYVPQTENVKYDSQNHNVKYDSENQNVKSVSSTIQNEKEIDELFNRLILSIEGRFNKALEKAKEELNVKYEALLKSQLTNVNETVEGTSKAKVNYCSPCTTLAVKYDPPKPKENNEVNVKTDYTPDKSTADNKAGEIVFPQMEAVSGIADHS